MKILVLVIIIVILIVFYIDLYLLETRQQADIEALESKPGKLQHLHSLCAASCTIEYNPHKDCYQSVEDYFQELSYREFNIPDEIGKDKYKIMIEKDTIICITAYPDTPVGFYTTYHYDLDLALDSIIESIQSQE
jgi:hypothetical protein